MVDAKTDVSIECHENVGEKKNWPGNKWIVGDLSGFWFGTWVV